MAKSTFVDVPSVQSKESTTISNAAAVGTNQTSTCQLKDNAGNNITGVFKTQHYYSTSANGATNDGQPGGIPAGYTDVLSDVNGLITVVSANAGGGSNPYISRLVIVIPVGVVVSAPLSIPNV